VAAPDGGAAGRSLAVGGRAGAGARRLEDGLAAVDFGAEVTVEPGRPLRLRLTAG
jgi:hypothetical protein